MATSARKQEFAILPSAARTVSANGPDLVAPSAERVIVWLNVTAVSGTTPTLDVAIQGKDPVSGAYVTLLSFAQATGTGAQVAALGAEADKATAPLASAFPVPRVLRVVTTIGGTTPNFTFSVGATLIGD